MEPSDTTATTITSPISSRSDSPSSASPPNSPPPRQVVIVSPCAACKILRRRCAEKCVLAPYFPPNDPIKFTTAHRVFGASNIIKFLQVYIYHSHFFRHFLCIRLNSHLASQYNWMTWCQTVLEIEAHIWDRLYPLVFA